MILGVESGVEQRVNGSFYLVDFYNGFVIREHFLHNIKEAQSQYENGFL